MPKKIIGRLIFMQFQISVNAFKRILPLSTVLFPLLNIVTSTSIYFSKICVRSPDFRISKFLARAVGELFTYFNDMIKFSKKARLSNTMLKERTGFKKHWINIFLMFFQYTGLDHFVYFMDLRCMYDMNCIYKIILTVSFFFVGVTT